MSSQNNINTNNLETDLVIIGGGGGGITAAVAAAENGAKVIVLEKRRVLGGNSIRAGNIFACESPVQKREMVLADKDELFQLAMKWAHWDRVDPRIVRAFINKSGDTIRWLQAKGMDFIFTPLYPNQLRVGHFPSEGGGAQLFEVLTRNCRDMGVQLILRTSAKKILRGTDGNISEVIAEDDEGKEFRIKTKSVIIASGGFGGNKELLKKHCKAYYDGMRLHGFAHTGDGLLMAEEVGAGIADSIPMLKEGPNPDSGEVLSLKLFVSEPYTIWVNKLGKRFIDETAGKMIFESGNAILRQPGRIMYTLFDSLQRQEMEKKTPPIVKTPKNGDAPDKGLAVGTPDLEKTLQFQREKGLVKIAESWDEIAAWIGTDPVVLKATIEEYNSFCEHGYDGEFVKARRYLVPLRSPPYYAIRCATTFLDTLGGIKVNEHMEVLDKQADVIPGLYAAGVIADGFQSDTYCSELCGSALGFAINSGRMAGENASNYVMKR
jgi:fumarate reductase flavoprotein subunit